MKYLCASGAIKYGYDTVKIVNKDDSPVGNCGDDNYLSWSEYLPKIKNWLESIDDREELSGAREELSEYI